MQITVTVAPLLDQEMNEGVRAYSRTNEGRSMA